MNAWAKSAWRPVVPMVKAIVVYGGPPVRQAERMALARRGWDNQFLAAPVCYGLGRCRADQLGA